MSATLVRTREALAEYELWLEKYNDVLSDITSPVKVNKAKTLKAIESYVIRLEFYDHSDRFDFFEVGQNSRHFPEILTGFFLWNHLEALENEKIPARIFNAAPGYRNTEFPL
jgi:hypothetical protein